MVDVVADGTAHGAITGGMTNASVAAVDDVRDGRVDGPVVVADDVADVVADATADCAITAETTDAPVAAIKNSGSSVEISASLPADMVDESSSQSDGTKFKCDM